MAYRRKNTKTRIPRQHKIIYILFNWQRILGKLPLV